MAAFLILPLARFMQQFEPRRKWDFNAISIMGICIFMGSPCPYKPKNNAHRLGYAFVLFGSIVFTTVTTTKVAKLFTSPTYNPQIQTVSEILDNRFDLIGNQFSLQKLLQKNWVKSRNFPHMFYLYIDIINDFLYDFRLTRWNHCEDILLRRM